MLITTVLLLAAATPPDGAWSARIDRGVAAVVIPFYEGVRIDDPAVALPEAGISHLDLAYPGVLSAPFVALRRDDRWQVAYVDALGPNPATLELRAGPVVTLRSQAAIPIRTFEVRGELAAVAAALRARWKPVGSGEPLARRFRQVNFYVHQFVGAQGLKMDWTLPALVERMKQELPTTIPFVYGYDPSGVDLGGVYFWSDGAEASVRQVIAANRRLAALNWLNLRTWKAAIPRLHLERPVTPDVEAMLKVYPPGVHPPGGQDGARSRDACLASAGWQRSRLAQLERLADLGFKVLQLDEFPIPAVWSHAPCQSARHLHRAGDVVDEWRQIDRFLRALAARARARGLILTCEEPSALMLPYVAGYIDRQFNDSIELYGTFRRSPRAAPIPLFSAIFGDLATPYTDADGADPARRPPPGWLIQHKVSPP